MPDMQYLNNIPGVVPAGKILVHNFAPRRPRSPLYVKGLRAWLTSETKGNVECKCGWAPGRKHYIPHGQKLRVSEATA